jgi:hypothetical protein
MTTYYYFRKSGSLVRIVGTRLPHLAPILLTVERIDTGKLMTVRKSGLEEMPVDDPAIERAYRRRGMRLRAVLGVYAKEHGYSFSVDPEPVQAVTEGDNSYRKYEFTQPMTEAVTEEPDYGHGAARALYPVWRNPLPVPDAADIARGYGEGWSLDSLGGFNFSGEVLRRGAWLNQYDYLAADAEITVSEALMRRSAEPVVRRSLQELVRENNERLKQRYSPAEFAREYLHAWHDEQPAEPGDELGRRHEEDELHKRRTTEDELAGWRRRSAPIIIDDLESDNTSTPEQRAASYAWLSTEMQQRIATALSVPASVIQPDGIPAGHEIEDHAPEADKPSESPTT